MKRARAQKPITVKPAPGSPHFPDPWARQALGELYPLWRRCGVLAEKNRLAFRAVFVAGQELRNEGRALRDGAILERARRRIEDEEAYSKWIDQRRRNNDGPSD